MFSRHYIATIWWLTSGPYCYHRVSPSIIVSSTRRGIISIADKGDILQEQDGQQKAEKIKVHSWSQKSWQSIEQAVSRGSSQKSDQISKRPLAQGISALRDELFLGRI